MLGLLLYENSQCPKHRHYIQTVLFQFFCCSHCVADFVLIRLQTPTAICSGKSENTICFWLRFFHIPSKQIRKPKHLNHRKHDSDWTGLRFPWWADPRAPHTANTYEKTFAFHPENKKQKRTNITTIKMMSVCCFYVIPFLAFYNSLFVFMCACFFGPPRLRPFRGNSSIVQRDRMLSSGFGQMSGDCMKLCVLYGWWNKLSNTYCRAEILCQGISGMRNSV